MDEFTGYLSAAKDVLPQAKRVMDPFHVVHLAAETHRVPAADPAGHTRASWPVRQPRVYAIKRALLTRATSSRKRDARQCSPTRNTSMSRSPNAHSDTCDRVIIYAHNRTMPRNRSRTD